MAVRSTLCPRSGGLLFAETVAEYEAGGDNSGDEGDEGCGVCGRDVARDEERCPDEEVEDPLEDVGDRRGESFAGRFPPRERGPVHGDPGFREGSGERFSADAFDEVGQGIHEETSGEEAGDVGIPSHGGDFSKGVVGMNKFRLDAEYSTNNIIIRRAVDQPL